MESEEASLQYFAPGRCLFCEGDTSREMYIIRSGRVRITISRVDKEIPITELGKGSFVGEMSLICGIPRTASVTAIEPVYANVITPDAYEHRVYGIPDWIQSIAKTLVERIRRTTIMLTDYIAVGDVPALEQQGIETIPDELQIQEDTQRRAILLAGYFYGESINRVKEVVNKQIARADTPLIIDFSGVVDVDNDVVDYIKELTQSSYVHAGRLKFKNVQLIYNRVSSLKGLSELIESNGMRIRKVDADSFLIREGEMERTMYVVRTGRFQIFRTTKTGETLNLGFSEPGDVIGEMALIREGKRSATVKAIKAATVYAIEPKVLFHGAYDVPEWFMNVIRGLIERLQSTNEMFDSISAATLSDDEETTSEPLGILVDSAKPGFFVLKGNLTFGNIDYLSAVLRNGMYEGIKSMTVDLRRVKLIDRHSIRYLLYMHTALKQGNGNLKLIGNKEKMLWLYKQEQDDMRLEL
ncbi:MAG: cyclic nucleotide-binding domain-containing protein [Alkalispirochaeta sp.]